MNAIFAIAYRSVKNWGLQRRLNPWPRDTGALLSYEATDLGSWSFTGSNPVEVLNFSGNCKNCVHNCENHSLFDFTYAVQYMIYFIVIAFCCQESWMSLYLENPFCNRPFSSSPHSLFQSESKCEILKTDLHNRQRLRTSLWNRDGSELGNFVLPVAGPVWDSLCCSTSQRGSHFTAATLLCICSSEQRFVRDILDCTSQISGEVGADLHADFISWVWTPKNCSQQSFVKRLWHSLFCYVKQILSLFYCLFSRGVGVGKTEKISLIPRSLADATSMLYIMLLLFSW